LLYKDTTTMVLYVPLVYFDVPEEEKAVCDFVLQVYLNAEDARLAHPNADIMELPVDNGVDPSLN